MTPEQLAELFVEEQCDNTMNIHTCIEILVKNAYKAGYECAVDKTEEWLEEQAEIVGVSFTDDFMARYLKEIQL
jgi:hypothetical protein